MQATSFIILFGKCPGLTCGINIVKPRFLSKGQWTYGPTLCLSIDTHIRSNFYRVVYF